MPPEVERDQRVEPRRARGSRPPTTLVPPPNGTTATPASAQACSTASDPVGVGRRDHRVRRRRAVARALGQQVEVGLAAAAQHARLAVVAHASPTRREPLAQRRRRAPARAAARPRAPPAGRRPRPRRRARSRSSAAACVGQRRARPRARPSPRRPARASRRAARRAPSSATSSSRAAAARRSSRPPKRAEPRGRWRSSSVTARPAVGRLDARPRPAARGSSFSNGVPSSSCDHARRRRRLGGLERASRRAPRARGPSASRSSSRRR